MSSAYADYVDFEYFVKLSDDILYPLFTVVFSYARWKSILFCTLLGIVYIVLRNSFTIQFVGILFASFFVADTFISQRMLRNASESVRLYATLTLTFCLMVFGIVSFTGGLEPYESALIAAVLYIIQARYRTTNVPLSKIQEQVTIVRKEQVEKITNKKNVT
jgi:hypothetical protein